MRYRRILREVAYREGSLERHTDFPMNQLKQAVQAIVSWYPVLKKHLYEDQHSPEVYNELVEVFGETMVRQEYVVAHGNALKIDFHVGHLDNGGVGVEVKVPANNSDIQRAKGQLDDYKVRYRSGEDLILLIFPYNLEAADANRFKNDIEAKGITVVMK